MHIQPTSSQETQFDAFDFLYEECPALEASSNQPSSIPFSKPGVVQESYQRTKPFILTTRIQKVQSLMAETLDLTSPRVMERVLDVVDGRIEALLEPLRTQVKRIASTYETLEITFTTLSPDALEEITSVFTNLKVLDLAYTTFRAEGATHDTYASFFQKMPQLQFCRLTGANTLSAAAVMQIVDQCPKLKALELSNHRFKKEDFKGYKRFSGFSNDPILETTPAWIHFKTK